MDTGEIIWGIILISLGILFLTSNVYGFNAWQIIGTYWPVILIVVGASILLRSYGCCRKK